MISWNFVPFNLGQKIKLRYYEGVGGKIVKIFTKISKLCIKNTLGILNKINTEQNEPTNTK